MTIDYLNKPHALSCGIEESYGGSVQFFAEGKHEKLVFKNFPHLHLIHVGVADCVFENCARVTASNSSITRCIFKNVSCVWGYYTAIEQCRFVESCSEGPLLTVAGAGRVDGCAFEDVTACGTDGYLIYSIRDKKREVQEIGNCRFLDCRVENEERKWLHWTYNKGFFRKEPPQSLLVD